MTLAHTAAAPPATRRVLSHRMGAAGALVLAAVLTACASAGSRASATAATAAPGAAVTDPRRGVAGGEVVRPGEHLFGTNSRIARWEGAYTTGAQRRGVLVLRLAEGAPGEPNAVAGTLAVAVSPRVSTFAARGGSSAAGARVTVPVARGRYVGGRLALDTEPYYDATCECTVTTSYRGVVRGDTLAGTYVTRGPATGGAVRGRWRAVRAPADRP